VSSVLEAVRSFLAEAAKDFGLITEVEKLRQEFNRLFGIDMLDDFEYSPVGWRAYHILTEEETDKLITPEKLADSELIALLLKYFGVEEKPIRIKIVLTRRKGEPNERWTFSGTERGFITAKQYSTEYHLALYVYSEDC